MAVRHQARVTKSMRTIVVARAHPQIMDPIHIFFDGIGYESRGHNGSSTFEAVRDPRVAGALISTGMTPQVEQSPTEVVARLRTLRSDLRIAILTMVPFDRIRRSISTRLGPTIHLVEGSSLALRSPNIGDPETLPVMQLADIRQADGRDTASAILARHFR